MFSNREDVKSLTGEHRNQRNFGTACPAHHVPTLEVLVSSEISDSPSFKKLWIVPASTQIFIPFHWQPLCLCLAPLSRMLDWAVDLQLSALSLLHLLRTHSPCKCLSIRTSERSSLQKDLPNSGTSQRNEAYTLGRNQRSLHQTAVTYSSQKMAAAVSGKYLLMVTTNVSAAVL